MHRVTRIYSIGYINVYVHTTWYPWLHVPTNQDTCLYMLVHPHIRTSSTSWYIHPTGWALNTWYYTVLHDCLHQCTRTYIAPHVFIRPYIAIHVRTALSTSMYTPIHRDTRVYTLLTNQDTFLYTRVHPQKCAHPADAHIWYIVIHVSTLEYICLHGGVVSLLHPYTCEYVGVHNALPPACNVMHVPHTSPYTLVHPYMRRYGTSWYIVIYGGGILHRDTSCLYIITRPYIAKHVCTRPYIVIHVVNH